MESEIEPDQWEAVSALFKGGFGGGRFCHAQRPLCCSVEAAGCRGLVSFSSGVREGDSFIERQLLNIKKSEELQYLTWGCSIRKIIFKRYEGGEGS